MEIRIYLKAEQFISRSEKTVCPHPVVTIPETVNVDQFGNRKQYILVSCCSSVFFPFPENLYVTCRDLTRFFQLFLSSILTVFGFRFLLLFSVLSFSVWLWWPQIGSTSFSIAYINFLQSKQVPKNTWDFQPEV